MSKSLFLVFSVFYVMQYIVLYMQFPPEFETGDGADMRLPNHVFNQLKVHSKVDNKRGHRVHEKKEHATSVCINFHVIVPVLLK